MTNQIDKAPAGATHRYEHAGLVSWYREVDGNMFTWRDGSWFASFFKSAHDLAQSCMLGKVTPLVADTAQQVADDLTWLVRETKGEWHGMATHIARDGADDYLWACAIHLMAEYPNHNWFSKAKYLARKAELQNKPSWKDAPEWATALTQDSAMEDGLGAWWWHEFAPTECERTWSSQGRAYPAKERGEVLGDWRDTVEQRLVLAGISGSDAAVGLAAGLKAFQVKAADAIDWSTAPAGATHHIGGNKLEFPWHRVGGPLRYWNGKIWVKRSAFHTLDEAVAKGLTVVARPADLSSEEVIKRLDEATQNVLAAVPGLMDEKYSFDPSVRQDLLQEHGAVTVAEGARSHADQEATRTAMLYCDLMRRLRSNPEHLDAEEFAAMHQLCDAELTKRDAAVCGGEHGKKFVLVLGDGTFGLVESGCLTWTLSLERATLMAEHGWDQFKRFGKLAEMRHGKLVMRVGGAA